MSPAVLQYSVDLRNHLCEKGLKEHETLKQLREETDKHRYAAMQICPEQGAFMTILVRLISAKQNN